MNHHVTIALAEQHRHRLLTEAAGVRIARLARRRRPSADDALTRRSTVATTS